MGDKTFSERLNLICVGSYWKRLYDDAIGVILEICDDNSNNLVVRWTNPNIEGSRAGTYDRYEFARKWVPLESHQDDITVVEENNMTEECDITIGSLWKEIRGCAKEHVGSLIKVTAIFGDIIKWDRIGYDAKDEGSNGSTCRSSFLYCFEHFCDPAPSWPGAIWYHTDGGVHIAISIKYENETVWFVSSDNKTLDLYWKMPFNEWAKTYRFYDGVVKPSCLPEESFDEMIKETKGRYKRVMEILKETEENKVVVGSIWKSKTSNEYVRIEITTGELIHFRPLTNKKSSRDIESMCRKRFLEDFKFEKDDDILALYVSDGDENKLAIITDYGSYPERVVCKFINMEKREVHTRVVGFIQFYHRYHLLSLDSLHEYRILHDSIEAIEKEKENKEKIEPNKRETYLNTDESKMKSFDTGAKREDKSGKGRYDLIPGDIMADLVKYAWVAYFIEGPATICDTDISLNAYFDDVSNEKMFFEFILSMTCLFFTDHEKLDETTDSFGERSYVVTWENFHDALYKMRELLAKHYEVGAKVHGVNNWKKGIPVSDSERGGNFVDSMRRHTDQALRGLDDEPHAISAIWNAFCAIWTIRNCK